MLSAILFGVSADRTRGDGGNRLSAHARLAAAPAATAAPTSPASGPSAAIWIGVSRLVSAHICALVAATKLSQYNPPVVPNPPPTITASGSSLTSTHNSVSGRQPCRKAARS